MNDEVRLKQKISRFIVPAALILPSLLMTAYLTYDEFWTLGNFSPLGIGQILTDLSLPNNHPLNSLAVKILSAFSSSAFFLRLISLICGAVVTLLCGELSYKWSKCNRLTAMICGAVLAGLSVPLAVYSGLARGYAMQLMFLLLFLLAAASVKENPVKSAWWCAIGAAGCILSVPSGALFLLPAGIGFLVYSSPQERRSKPMWIAAAVTAVAAGIFYGINFSALRAGQEWGVKIASGRDFLEFLLLIGGALCFTPALLASVLCWFSDRCRWKALVLLFLPLLLAIVSNGGPARTYLYIPAAIAVSGGIGIAELFEKWKFPRWSAVVTSVILGAGGIFMQLDAWKMVDYVAVFEENMDSLPPGTLPVYRASAGYPVICGALKKSMDKFYSITLDADIRNIAVFEAANGVFNGMDKSMGECQMETTCRGREAEFNGLACVVYSLEKSDGIIEKDGVYLIMFDRKNKLPENFYRNADILELNVWLNSPFRQIICRSNKTMELPADGFRAYRTGGKL